jgi:hypothetical protein
MIDDPAAPTADHHCIFTIDICYFDNGPPNPPLSISPLMSVDSCANAGKVKNITIRNRIFS